MEEVVNYLKDIFFCPFSLRYVLRFQKTLYYYAIVN